MYCYCAGTDIKSVDMNGRTPLQLAKARLKVLSGSDLSYSALQLKEEVTQVCPCQLIKFSTYKQSHAKGSVQKEEITIKNNSCHMTE